ncbi:MAG: hypothetical protein JWN43_1291 [Gammaproteobacteria bacterium]|nr:hypothetical protein [Gammaproteobacteria bacterium]
MATLPITASSASTAAPAVSSKAPTSAPTASAKSSTPAAGNSPAAPVKISAAALVALAASKELSETSAQTAVEAQGGDSAAQRLLAKSAANAAQYKA